MTTGASVDASEPDRGARVGGWQGASRADSGRSAWAPEGIGSARPRQAQLRSSSRRSGLSLLHPRFPRSVVNAGVGRNAP